MPRKPAPPSPHPTWAQFRALRALAAGESPPHLALVAELVRRGLVAVTDAGHDLLRDPPKYALPTGDPRTLHDP